MMARIWHGGTRRQNSDAYEKLLKEEVFAGIASMRIPGYKGIRLLRATVGEEDEFVTIILKRTTAWLEQPI